ncbi:MAG: OmpA family protein [Pseudomonadota bacterium]
MPISSSKWDVALVRSLSGGEFITAGFMHFKLRNVESGTTSILAFYGAGGGGSVAPVSYSENLKASFKRFRSTRPTTFEDIDGKGAIMRTGGASGPTGGSGPSISGVWLKILEGLNPWGAALLDIKLGSASFGMKPGEGWSTPNIGIERHWGWVKVKLIPEDPLDLPDEPEEPLLGPTVIAPTIPFELPPPPPPVRPTKKTFEADVLFGFDSSRIRKEAEPELHKLVYELESRAAPRVMIEGHADSTGKATYNRDLSRRRAQAVKDWLVKAGAPDAPRYTTVGKGEAEPIADNKTSHGRAQNRRVEITIN